MANVKVPGVVVVSLPAGGYAALAGVISISPATQANIQRKVLFPQTRAAWVVRFVFISLASRFVRSGDRGDGTKTTSAAHSTSITLQKARKYRRKGRRRCSGCWKGRRKGPQNCLGVPPAS